jgi:hypothetical protein
MIIIEKSKYRLEKLKKDWFVTFLYEEYVNNKKLYWHIVPLLDLNWKPYFILSNWSIEWNWNFWFRTRKYEKNSAIEFLRWLDLSNLFFLKN